MIIRISRRCGVLENITWQRIYHLNMFFALLQSRVCTPHLCERKTIIEPTWFENGPPLQYLPFPVPDPSKSWGVETCERCTGLCASHFLLPEEAYIHRSQSVCEPLPQNLLEVHKSPRGCVSDDTVSITAKQLLLQISDVNLWLQHLDTVQQNCQEGARKAAETRQKKKDAETATECRCRVCGYLYEEETEELWVTCDKCQACYHVFCVHLLPDSIPDEFYSPKCLQQSVLR